MFNIESHFTDREFVSTDFLYLPPKPESHPSPIWMAGGRSNYKFYPVTQVDVHVKPSPDAESTVTTIPSTSEDPDSITTQKYFQYGPPRGHPELLKFATSLIQDLQAPKCEVDYLVTSGSGDSLTKLLQVFLTPGDTILVENFAYTPIFGPIQSVGGIMIPYPVVLESGGPVIDVPALTELLETWDEGKYKHLKKPKIIYTVPTQNPLGVTQPLKVREAVYALSQKHDLVIFEDDPDGWIHMSDKTFAEYKEHMKGSSYLNLDTDGRVMRMETFSKLVFPGIRLGFICAPPVVIDRLASISRLFTKTASGVSQAVFLKTVEHLGGGVDGFLSWCYEVSKEYKLRRDTVFGFFESCESVKKGYIKPIKPDAGMFFVIQVNFDPTIEDVQPELEKLHYKLLEKGVLVVLGRDMAFTEDWRKRANFVRMTNTHLVSADDCLLGAQRFNDAVLAYFE